MAWFMMLNADTGVANWMEIGLTYAALGLIILISLIALAIVKKSIRKEASLAKAKAKCIRAEAYAIRMMQPKGKRDLLIASTKLAKLSSLILEAEWNVLCIVEEKKDIVVEGLLGNMDALAKKISTKAEEAFFQEEEYIAFVKEVKHELSDITEKMGQIMQEKGAV